MLSSKMHRQQLTEVVEMWLWICCKLLFCCIRLTTGTSVIATSPVNPVQEGGILSVHCQVIGLQDDHGAALFRQVKGGKTERLSLNEDVLSTADDDVFIAWRASVYPVRVTK